MYNGQLSELLRANNNDLEIVTTYDYLSTHNDKISELIKELYPGFYLIMDCFWCSVKHGELKLLEHEAAKWLPLDDLMQVKWLPADVEVIEAIYKEREYIKFSLMLKTKKQN